MAIPRKFFGRTRDFYLTEYKELQSALEKEYGAARGGLLYSHLKALFEAPEPPAQPEKPAKTSRPRRNYRRKKAAAEKTAE